MQSLADIREALQEGDDEKVAELTQAAIDAGVAPRTILDDGLIAGMNVVGERFKLHEIFLPDVLMSAKAMYAGMGLLKPLLEGGAAAGRGRVVIGTVQGDLHDIGKNLVAVMLKGAGFEVIDLGNDVAPERFIRAARNHDVQVIGMSALLTTTMPAMQKVVELATREGLREKVKVIIGGAPVNEHYAAHIGADAYGFDAANAVERVKALIGRPDR